MKPDFSEFSYGYSVTEKLIQFFRQSGSPIRFAPVFPSLIEEGKPGVGYDAAFDIGIPVFLQFKLSHFFVRSYSYGFDLFNSPFYRFKLMPINFSPQHQSLLLLESDENEVDYVAPIFYRNYQLDNFYINDLIIENSVFIRPSAIGDIPDNNQHYICFKDRRRAYRFPYKIEITAIDSVSFTNRVLAFRFSEPKQLEEEVDLIAFIKRVIDKIEKKGSIALKPDSLGHLIELMIKIIKETYSHRWDDSHIRLLFEKLKPLDLIAYLSTTFFGCTFSIAGYQDR